MGSRSDWRPRLRTATRWPSRWSARTRCRLMNSVPPTTRTRTAALEIHAGAALVGVVGGVEARGQPGADRAVLERQRLAGALVAEAGDDHEEALGIRLAQVGEAGLVTDQLDGLARLRRAGRV